MPYLKKAKKQRNPSNNRIERQKIYNTNRWHKLRAGKLMQSPLCEVCLSKGVITPAFHIHHIDSFMNYEGMKRKEVAYNPDNLMSICEQCHNKLHNQIQRLCGAQSAVPATDWADCTKGTQ